MNCTPYIFGSLGEGYQQYPDDYTHALFELQSQRLVGNTLFAIHREGNLMYYSGYFRVGADEFIGLGIVTNNVMVTNHHALMEIFQNALDYIVVRGELLRRIERKVVVGDTELTDQRSAKQGIDHLQYLIRQLDHSSSASLPPVSYDMEQNSEIWFRYDNAIENVAQASVRYAYTYLSELGERTTIKPSAPKTTPTKAKKRPSFLIILLLILAGWMVYPHVQKRLSSRSETTQATTDFATAQKDALRRAAEYYNSKEYKKAFDTYAQLANEGNTIAQYQLGQLYRMGQGVAADAHEAATWYETAAESGYAEAQYRLGVMMYYGDGIPQRRKKGLEWIRKAAKQGHEKSLALLGKANH